MNFPNFLTLLRVVLGILVPIMMVMDDFWIRVWSAILFAIAAFSDWLDGWYARKFNLVTKFGQIMDPLADKIIVLGSFVAMSSCTEVDAYSIWWVVPMFIREVTITVYRMLFLIQKNPVVVAAEQLGKAKTLLQMATLPFAYFYFMLHTYSTVNVTILMYVLYFMLAASVYLTLHSGVEFFVKNWRVIRKMSF